MEWVKFLSFIALSLGVLGVVGHSIKSIVHGSRDDAPSNKKAHGLRVLGAMGVFLLGSFFLCRPLLHVVVYDGLYKFVLGSVLPTLWTTPFFFLAYLQFRRLKGARANRGMAVLTTITALGLLVSLFFGRVVLTNYFIAREYQPQVIDSFPVIDPERERDAAFEVAVTSLQNEVGVGNYTIDPEHVFPADVDGTFGYAGTITATTGLLKWKSGPGIVVYNDGPQVPGRDRTKLLRFDNIPYGPERMLFNNIYWRLKAIRMWGDFEEVYLSQLIPGDDSSWVYVAPYTVQVIKFPGFLAPAWGGTVVIDVASGVHKDLSPQQIASDPDYQGRIFFPISLAKRYVEVRNYDAPGGLPADIWQWMFSTQHEIEISEFAGYNQQPVVYPAANNKTYYQITVEPKGKGAPTTKAVHFVDATTGEYTVFTPDKTTMSPDTASRLAREKLGHRWGSFIPDIETPVTERERPEDTKMLTLEPRPFSIDGTNILFRVAVTSTDFTSAEDSERVFIDGVTREREVFDSRNQYLALIREGHSLFTDEESEQAVELPVRVEQLEKKVELLTERLNETGELNKKLEQVLENQARMLRIIQPEVTSSESTSFFSTEE